MNIVGLDPLDSAPGSFRDPAGRIFTEGGVTKRLVTRYGLADYGALISTGLAGRLQKEGLLVGSKEERETPDGSKILIPDQIPTISYPYEWSFSQLKDAGLLTLRVARTSLEHGMILKDASAFNVQFVGCRPIFIDTLSFEPNAGGGWKAYGQFCRHFLAPLMVLSKVSLFFQPFWKHSIDGLPLNVASALLPKRTYFRPGALIHIHLHALSIEKHSDPFRGSARSNPEGPDRKAALLDSLEATVRGLSAPGERTQWQDYYRQASHYSEEAEQSKRQVVERVIESVRPSSLIDFGGNVGEYARIGTQRGARCICLDIDPQCVDANYRRGKSEADSLMLPLVMDLANPSGGIGFANRERMDLRSRCQSDLGLALALIHHLRITEGIPLARIAGFLAECVSQLLVEFVPKDDPMVQALLRGREDVFHDYTLDGFANAFGRYYHLEQSFDLADTERKLYLFSAYIAPNFS